MKRSLTLALTLAMALTVALAGIALAGPGSKAHGGGDWISSFGQAVKGSFDAEPDKTGAGGKGMVRIDVDKGESTEFRYTGKVDCYSQTDDNIARFSGVITKGEGDQANDRYFVWAVLDGGEPGHRGDMIRTATLPVPFDCRNPAFAPRNPLLKGNFHVHPLDDGPPPPPRP